MSKARFACIVIFLAMYATAKGGTVITNNLPTGDAIINIAGDNDGAASYGGSTGALNVIGVNQDQWFQPFSGSGPLLEYTIQPGTYNFRIINEATAASMFPTLIAGQLDGISASGAWTYNTPWGTDWIAFDSSAASDSTEHQLISGAITPDAPSTTGWIGGGYDNGVDAYNEAINSGVFDEIVTGTGRYTGTVQSSYTFSSAQTLIFAVPDYDVEDNNGSVSVLITPAASTGPSAVPLPAPVWTALSVLALLGLVGGVKKLRKITGV